MATGISTSLGYSVPQIGGMFPTAEIYDNISKRKTSLMYELGLSSYPPVFINGNFVSPLTPANASLYKYNYGVSKKKKCEKFNKNKNVNPTTGRPIKRNGAKYKDLNKECKKMVISKKMCEEFIKLDKRVNPITGRAIKKDGPIYNSFVKKCELKLSANKPSKVKPSTEITKIDYNIFKSKLPKVPESYPMISSRAPSPALYQRPTTTRYPGNPGVRIYPEWVQPDPSDSVSNGVNYTIQPRKFISFNGKNFKIGDTAIIDTFGTRSIITNIGYKQITLKKDMTSKENRLTIDTFIKANVI